MSDVPRRAVFDDLRVGQWVAFVMLDDECSPPVVGVGGGRITHIRRFGPQPQRDHAEIVEGSGVRVMRDMCERGEVTILRDAPAPPVTVRREDYDALVEKIEGHGPNCYDRGTIVRAARALIDHADTGNTP